MTDTFDPMQIARELPTMWWPELDALADQLVTRMTMTSEASGAPVGGRVSSGKPGSAAPHGQPALADEQRERLTVAATTDLEAYYAAVDAGEPQPEPLRYRQAILRAAVALRQVTHRSDQTPNDLDASDTSVERTDWILATYEGLDPHYAAALETSRAGYVTAEVIRRVRRKNGRHRQTGESLPIEGDLRDAVLAAHRLDPDRSVRAIAADLDIGKSTVASIIAAARSADRAA
ncbi:MAG: hypothetical protein AB7G37_00860 [Solirubrobacteraceae bacterium]